MRAVEDIVVARVVVGIALALVVVAVGKIVVGGCLGVRARWQCRSTLLPPWRLSILLVSARNSRWCVSRFVGLSIEDVRMS